MPHDKKLLDRRDVLKRGALAGAGLLAAPMLNLGRFRIFAESTVEYSSRAIDLVQQSVVIEIDIEGLNHPKRMYDLTEGLIRRKYSDASIQGILGGNFKRVLSSIWTT